MKNEFSSRLARFRDALRAAGIDAAIIGPSADFRYLTGCGARISERFVGLLVPAASTPLLIVPALEEPHFSASGLPIRTWQDGEDPIALLATTVQQNSPQLIGVNDELWAAFLLPLQQSLPGVRFCSVSPLLSNLRSVKSAAELALLREAVARVDAAWARFCRTASLVGHTERQVAARLTELLLEEGLDEVAFCIVASGPNAASPHHEPSHRVIAAGDPVVIDIGGPYRGYFADLTRTPLAGALTDREFASAYEAVLEAQEAAFAAVRPGVPCETIDRIARDVLAQHSLAHAFIHRLGHGLGLSVHEPPYLVSGNPQLLRPGMVMTIEPGVYLPGRWGVRIEDVVVVTETGAERLTSSPHDLLELP